MKRCRTCNVIKRDDDYGFSSANTEGFRPRETQCLDCKSHMRREDNIERKERTARLGYDQYPLLAPVGRGSAEGITRPWTCADAVIAAREYLECALLRQATAEKYSPCIQRWALEAAAKDTRASTELREMLGTVALAPDGVVLRAALEDVWKHLRIVPLPAHYWEVA